MEQFWGDTVVVLCSTLAPQPPHFPGAKLSLTAQQQFVGAPAATPRPTTSAPKLVQPALVPPCQQKPPPQLPEPTQHPWQGLLISAQPCCSCVFYRHTLKIPVFLEKVHWHFTRAFIFTNSCLHYFCCFLLCILGSLYPNGHYEPFFCPLHISSSPRGSHTPSPTPLPIVIHPPAAGSQENSQRPRQHSQEGRLNRSRSLILQENWGAKGNR